MKNTKRILGVLAGVLFIFVTGCESAGTDGGDSGSSSVLEGTIDSWTLGAGYTIEARADDTAFGTSNVAADGSFSLSLRTPSPGEVQSVSSLEIFGITVSNADANYVNISELAVLDSNGTTVGEVAYGSGTVSQQWYYADASVTVNGTITFIFNVTYDSVALSQGWNEVRTETDPSTFAQTLTNGTVSGTWSYSPTS